MNQEIIEVIKDIKGKCDDLIYTIQAKKVEPKQKAYYVTDEYSFNCLMKELDEQGYVWRSGNKTTDLGAFHKSVIYLHDDKKITHGLKREYDMRKYKNYDLIDYHKEEPRCYAKIKGGKFLEPNHQYFRWHKKLEKITIGNNIRCAGNKDILDHYMTKSEWEELGINDTNADFEEVEE